MTITGKKYGRIDILVSNAGNASAPSEGTQMNIADFDDVVKTHIYGALHLSQACGEIMKERKYGRIVIIASIASRVGLLGNINYAVGKTGQMGLVYTLAKELGQYGITVNAVQPGITETPLTAEVLKTDRELLVKDIPVNRIGQPEDIAHATSFLCMKESSFISGIGLVVDGGNMTHIALDKIMNNIIS